MESATYKTSNMDLDCTHRHTAYVDTNDMQYWTLDQNHAEIINLIEILHNNVACCVLHEKQMTRASK